MADAKIGTGADCVAAGMVEPRDEPTLDPATAAGGTPFAVGLGTMYTLPLLRTLLFTAVTDVDADE